MDEINRATVLAVDDDPSNVNIIAGHLRSLNVRLLVANCGERALSLASQERIDVILMDIRMPGMDGLEACRTLKSSPKTANVPIIFLTASDTDIATAFSVGGADYILKPVRQDELLARVGTQLKVSKLIRSLSEANALLEGTNLSLEEKVQARTRELVTANRNLRREVDERRRLQDRISYLSQHDFITRMLNRAAMEDEIEKHIDVLRNQPGHNQFLLFIDLDHFKVVNDACGHIAGDELLRQLADTLRSITHASDICARMGGDEFAILFSADDLGLAISKTRLIKTALESMVFEWNDESFQHNVSMALVELDNTIDSVSHLLSIAERTCYYSKIKGGSEISVFNASRELIEKSQEQARQVPLIRQAVTQNKLVLHAQRIMPLIEGLPQKAEVLVRMLDASGKLRFPGHFIPVAERYHLIDSIDRWVIQHALSYIARQTEDFQWSINLSGDFIAKENAADYIVDLLHSNSLRGERICFEITETSAISNIEATIAFIDALQPAGCKFALDDFGTGTSSYEFLKKLAVDYVKIDGMFVRDVEKDPISQKMVESITAIARAKQIAVIAECVETEEAREILASMGVDYIQGFCCHRPEPIENLSASLP